MASTPTDGHLQVPGLLEATHRIKNVPGYTTPVFKGKEEQKAKVLANVTSKVSFRVPLRRLPQRRARWPEKLWGVFERKEREALRSFFTVQRPVLARSRLVRHDAVAWAHLGANHPTYR